MQEVLDFILLLAELANQVNMKVLNFALHIISDLAELLVKGLIDFHLRLHWNSVPDFSFSRFQVCQLDFWYGWPTTSLVDFHLVVISIIVCLGSWAETLLSVFLQNVKFVSEIVGGGLVLAS